MLSWEIGLLAAIGLLDVAILARIVAAQYGKKRRTRRRAWMRRFMRSALVAAPESEVVRALQWDAGAFLSEYMLLVDSVALPEELSEKVQQALVRAHRFPRLIRDLRSRSVRRRTRAAVQLSYAAPVHAIRPLLSAFEQEQRRPVRLYLAYALARLGRPAVIPSIIDSLCDSDDVYREQVCGLLQRFGTDLHDYFPILRSRREPEIQTVVARIAAERGDEIGRDYLLELVQSGPRETVFHATGLLLRHYIYSIDIDELLGSDELVIVNLTLESLGRLAPEQSLARLLSAVDTPATRKSAVVGLSRLVHDRPQSYLKLVDTAMEAADDERRDALLEVVSNRVEYLIDRVLRAPGYRSTLEAIVNSGRVSGIISFLNRNEDHAVAELITDAIGPALQGRPELVRRFVAEAKADVCQRLGIAAKPETRSRHTRVGEATPVTFILGILFLTVLAPIGVYAAARGWGGGLPSGWAAVGAWALDYTRGFTRFFAWYAFVLNIIYLALLAVAASEIRRRQAVQELKSVSMLFSPGMLPSISVIAPAFNEEATIVESINSLLNLRYPDFEIIVVNDGSNDRTLARLVDNFELERVDIFLHDYLRTRPVRGIYRNPRIPELIVIDKENGGKADSLNVGINASRKSYFAAIDSDSLLERDSLLLLAARFLDSDVPVVATGGNVFPVNGCTVSSGKLDEVHLPRELLGRFQALEYIRSFMAGRTGWAGIGSLMIISGAFGLFRKKDVIDAHGYLTGSGYYAKDTVAEDMELVVRVARTLRDRGSRFAVQYGNTANCWTEVPVTHRVLKSQRDRWQRGLIDTMYYHAGMLANPRYGAMGLVGFPYYFLFELLGPWVEIQGLVFLIVGIVAGFLTPGIVILVLTATIPLGVAVSLSSLLLVEYHRTYFTPGDRLRLLLLAVIENIGYRQYAGFLRLSGYISALTRRTGWGTMTRKGFAADSSVTTQGGAQ